MQHFAADSCGQAAVPVQRHGQAALTAALCFFLLLGLCVMPAVHKPAGTAGVDDVAEPGWVAMPAGARSAYLGIHGGTVPVSLLVTSTGTSLISFVGQTGNDFLALLRKAELRLPSFLTNATDPGKTEPVVSAPRESMTAGTRNHRLPVIKLPDDSIFMLTSRPGLLQPFGLSDRPLGIEGDVTMPSSEALQPRYHILVDPKYLQPR